MSTGRQRWRRVRDGLTAVVVRAMSLVLGLLPWSVAQSFGAGFGRLSCSLAHTDRRRAAEHLAIAFPELGDDARQQLARRSFEHLGSMLFECLHLWRRSGVAVDRVVDVEGQEVIDQARRSGRPIMILTGHCGNWELLAATINRCGLSLAVVARGMDNDRINRLLLGMRSHFGSATIERGAPGAARRLLRTLRDGGALGMLIDQDTLVDGDWVPFFGRPAYTPLGAAQIALRQGAVVIPTFIARKEDGRHRAVFHPALELPEDATAATAMMTATIEAQIRRHPTQWVWMHRRWRRRPPEELASAPI